MVKRFFRSRKSEPSISESSVDKFSFFPKEDLIDLEKVNDAASVIDDMFGKIPEDVYELSLIHI